MQPQQNPQQYYNQSQPQQGGLNGNLMGLGGLGLGGQGPMGNQGSPYNQPMPPPNPYIGAPQSPNPYGGAPQPPPNLYGGAPQPDQFGNPMPDQFGNPMQQSQPDQFGNPTPDQFGNPMQQPQPDQFGNPMDAGQFGNPMQQPQPDQFGNPMDAGQQTPNGQPMQGQRFEGNSNVLVDFTLAPFYIFSNFFVVIVKDYTEKKVYFIALIHCIIGLVLAVLKGRPEISFSTVVGVIVFLGLYYYILPSNTHKQAIRDSLKSLNVIRATNVLGLLKQRMPFLYGNENEQEDDEESLGEIGDELSEAPEQEL